jgi:hypothetical protein
MREQPIATTSPEPAAVTEISTDVSADTVSVNEIIARYPGQWILLQVTADEHGWPARGRLLARADTLEEIARLRTALVPRVNLADGPLYVFDAYPPIKAGEDLSLAFEKMRDENADPFRWPRV